MESRKGDAMNRLSDRQLLHRQYLQSPAWKAKRMEALESYGCVCNRCGKYGNDVHHKTYKRVGNEHLEDLEVLCRDCHEAHHAIERSLRGRKQGHKAYHVKAMFAALSEDQKKMLQDTTGDDLHFAIVYKRSKKCDKIRNKALELLGGDRWYGLPKLKKGYHQSPKHYRPSIRY